MAHVGAVGEQGSASAQAGSLATEALWKVFGPKPDRAIEMSEAGATRAEVLDATGCTIGVRDVSLSVLPGETFVVMGLSGSGKSTLVRCMSRLADPTRGRVLLDGADLTAMNEAALRDLRRKKLSMVFQHFGLFPHRRVIDNAAYGLEVQGVARDVRRARALDVLRTVGLDGYEMHYPSELSGGMQQRVGLARALTVEPEILFFDEPFSALDPLIRRDMQDELLRLQRDLRRTVVFITHDFAEAIKLGDRIAIMKDGVIDQIGTAQQLIAAPATDYVREFTEDIPKTSVLTARDVLATQPTPVTSGAAGPAERSVRATATVDSFLSLMLADTSAVTVIDDDQRPIGVVDRDRVIQLLGDD